MVRQQERHPFKYIKVRVSQRKAALDRDGIETQAHQDAGYDDMMMFQLYNNGM